MRTHTVHVDIPNYGTVDLNSYALDYAISRYLPESPFGLCNIIEERTGERPRAGTPVVALLAMLADFDCNVDNHPLAYKGG